MLVHVVAFELGVCGRAVPLPRCPSAHGERSADRGEPLREVTRQEVHVPADPYREGDGEHGDRLAAPELALGAEQCITYRPAGPTP